MSKRINRAMREYYESCLEQAGDRPEGADWKSREAQEEAFRVLASGGITADSSVLDVGCGLAHLADYLRRLGFRGRYTGIDISPKMVEAAKRRDPSLDVRCVDLLADRSLDAERFDFVVACGVFTERFDIPLDEFERFVRGLVGRMYELCRVATAFNMLTDAVDYRVDRLYYASPAAYLEFARSLTRYVTLRHDYPAYFFTLYLYREPHSYPPCLSPANSAS